MRAEGVLLQDSHIVPQWAYDRLRTKKGNPFGIADPILVNSRVAVATSEQVKEHLLCSDCEQRLGIDEDYVARLAVEEDGSFPFMNGVPAASVIRLANPRPRAWVAPIGHLNCLDFARFAASVFWRAHVSTRKDTGALELPSNYAESLRLFVLGRASLPNTLTLYLLVPVLGDSLEPSHGGQFSLPSSAEGGANGFHQFDIHGFVFNLATGNKANPGICISVAQDPMVIFQHYEDVALARNVAANAKKARPTGKLARAFQKHRRKR